MRTLDIDIETYSDVDLAKAGVYKYVESPNFEVLMLAYQFDDDKAEIIDFTLPSADTTPVIENLIRALFNDSILKTAWNANFERTCLSKFLGEELNPNQWECSMVKAAMLGLPLSLDQVSRVLKLDTLKDSAGKALITYFSKPCKPTKSNGGRLRNLPEHAPDKWNAFKEYCKQDVRTELAIRQKIKFFEIPDFEKRLWNLDQKINDNGIKLDRVLIENAIKLDTIYRERLTKEAIELTSLSNPNSVQQLTKWLSDELEENITTLRKADIPELLNVGNNVIVTRVLEIRQEMSKTSIKKYASMRNAICEDDRLRGLFQFYGANRTGRWSGRLVQPQNLPQNHLEDLALARELVRLGDLDTLEMLFGNVPDTLSQLIRTAFIADDDCSLGVADFSAIEARVIAWLAGEKWRLQVFNTHGKIYEASASQMFKVPIEEITKGSPLRQKGKVAELALGYQGGANALITMGALKQGILEDELQPIVDAWRSANPAIVRLWRVCNDAAIKAVAGEPTQIMHGVKFYCANNILYIELPSKRKLCYLRPQLKPGKFGSEALTYEGLDQTTKQWKRMDTYGGKLVENIVQAIARDCLAVKLLQLDELGYNIAMHVHDEVVINLSSFEQKDLERINQIMSERISWAKELPLNADSYSTFFYRKD